MAHGYGSGTEFIASFVFYLLLLSVRPPISVVLLVLSLSLSVSLSLSPVLPLRPSLSLPVSPQFHHSFTTVSPQFHHSFTTVSPQFHHSFTTVSPPTR